MCIPRIVLDPFMNLATISFNTWPIICILKIILDCSHITLKLHLTPTYLFGTNSQSLLIPSKFFSSRRKKSMLEPIPKSS